MHTNQRQISHILLIVLFLISLNATISATGVVDTTFGTGGRAESGWSGSHSGGKILIQPDDKILIAGGGFSGGGLRIFVARYNQANGNLDNTFGTGGITAVGLSASFGDAVLQPDGKIVVVGQSDLSFSTNNFVYIIARFNADGNLDQTFGTNGQVKIDRTPNDARSDRLTSVAIQPDGKILAAGQRSNSVGEILRLNADGTIDTTFGAAGYMSFAFLNFDRINSLVLTASGKILAIGSNSSNSSSATIFRLNPNGDTDASFGQNGIVQTTDIYRLKIQPDEKIIAAGVEIRRLLPDGQLDTTFKVSSRGSALVKLLPDGRILTADADRLYLLAADGRLIGKAEKPQRTNEFDLLAFADVETQSNGKIIATVFSRRPFTPTFPTSFFFLRYNAITSLGNRMVNFFTDEKTNFGVFRPSTNSFLVLSNNGQSISTINANTPVRRPIPESYYDPFQTSFIWSSTDQSLNNFCGSSGNNNPSTCFQWGLSTDNPVGGDYDGDNLTDYTVIRDGVWHILQSSTQTHRAVTWGFGTDKPVPADYDADGKTDIAVYRPSNGVWYVLRSTEHFTAYQFGAPTDLPVPADYDGDGRADVAVYRPSNGVWYMLQSTGGFTGFAFGASEDRPVPGDYDGDGKTDIAVWRPSNAVWYLQQSKVGFGTVQWGQSGDIPLSIAYSTY